MNDLVKIPSMRPEPERDKYGRYVLPHPTTGRRASWTRATTLKDALKDKEGLIGWKQRLAAVGMAMRPELGEEVLKLHAEVVACGDDWRSAKEPKEALAKAVELLHDAAGGNEGSDRGTQAHTLTEYADAGRLAEVKHLATDSELADLQAYLSCMVDHGIERPAEWIERIVVNTRVESAGTFDRLVRLADGRLVVADVKSQKDFAFGFLDVACQLAQYVHADAVWDYDTKSWVPLPEELNTEIGIVMHVPVGQATCELYEIDLVAGWEAALLAYEVRTTRGMAKNMGRKFDPARPQDNVFFAISRATTVEELTEIWRQSKVAGTWKPHYNGAAAARRRILEIGA